MTSFYYAFIMLLLQIEVNDLNCCNVAFFFFF